MNICLENGFLFIVCLEIIRQEKCLHGSYSRMNILHPVAFYVLNISVAFCVVGIICVVVGTIVYDCIKHDVLHYYDYFVN